MSFPTHFHGLGNAINLRWVDDQGRHHTDRITNWGPTLYTTTNEKDCQYQSLTGENLKQLPFDSIKDAKNFIDEYGSVEGFRLFGNDNWAYQYVDSRWPEEHVSYDETKIKVYYLDIETEVGNEFPRTETGLAENQSHHRVRRQHVSRLVLQGHGTERRRVWLPRGEALPESGRHHAAFVCVLDGRQSTRCAVWLEQRWI